MNLHPLRDRDLSLDELAALSGRLLRGGVAPSDDERVSPAPDARTLRYYQGLGLLDRPLRYDGRNAVYGYRHLLQALCVKLLQAQGLSLSQIQRALGGASTEALEAALRDVPGVDPADSPNQLPPAPAAARALIAVELAPGVGVWIDPSRVPDPDSVIATLSRALRDPVSRAIPGDAP